MVREFCWACVISLNTYTKALMGGQTSKGSFGMKERSARARRDRCKVQAAWKVGGAGPGGRGREEREGAVYCLFFPP